MLHESIGIYTFLVQFSIFLYALKILELFLAAQVASADGVNVFKFQRWRLKGKILPEVFEQYSSVKADLNVMPFCSQFIPMEVITKPKHQSIIYHPSILPRHRGASAINW